MMSDVFQPFLTYSSDPISLSTRLLIAQKVKVPQHLFISSFDMTKVSSTYILKTNSVYWLRRVRINDTDIAASVNNKLVNIYYL